MALVHIGNVDNRILISSPFDTLGTSLDCDLAFQFLLTDSLGTAVEQVFAKGPQRVALHRKAGTTNGMQALFRDAAGSLRITELGTVTLDEWHVFRLRFDGPNQFYYIDGVEVATSAWTGRQDLHEAFQIGGYVTSGGITVKSAQFACWGPKLDVSSAAIVDGGTTNWDVVDTTGKVWWRYDFTKETIGTATNADTGFDNENTDPASLGDFALWTGKTPPTWDATTPLGAAAAIQVTVSSGGVVNESVQPLGVDDGKVINLGTIPKTWSNSSPCRISLTLNSAGTGAALTNVVISATSGGSVISPLGTVASIEPGSNESIVVELDTATVGAKSSTITIECDQLPDRTFVLNWSVHEDTDRTVTPGGGFVTPPTESAAQIGVGDFTYRPSAQVDVASYYWVDSHTLEVTCCCDHAHIGWIESIEVYFESDTVSKTIYTPKMSPSARSGAVGFSFTLDVSGSGDGDYTFYVKVKPVEGKERQLGPYTITFNGSGALDESTIYVDPNGNDANDGSSPVNAVQTIAQAVSLCASINGGHKVVCNAAGTYDATESDGVDSVRASDRVNRVVIADGLSYGDVVFVRPAGRAQVQFRTRKLQFEDIKFDTHSMGSWSFQGTDNGSGFANLNFVRCGFVDIVNGAGGPEFGYGSLGATPGTPDAGLWFDTYFAQKTFAASAMYNTREWVGYSGPTGTLLIAGGLNGVPFTPHHNADNVFGTRAIFGLSWQQAEQTPWLHYTLETTLTVASASYDGGTGKTTVTFLGSPTLRDTTSGDSVDVTTRLYVVEGGSPNKSKAYVVAQTNSVDNTAKTIVCDGDATADFTPGAIAFLSAIQHQDAWQFILGSTDGNVVYNRGYLPVNDEVQPSLVKDPYSVADITSVALQLFGFTGGNFFRWEENYYNLVIRQSSHPLAHHNISNVVAASATIGCVQEDAQFTNVDSLLEPADYDPVTLRPSASGDLQGMYFPRLPVDYDGNPVSRDGSAYFGFRQLEVSQRQITLSFSQLIQAGVGSVVLRANNGSWSDVESFDIATGLGDNGGSISIFGPTLTITPGAKMASGTEHAIRVEATVIKGLLYNSSFAGILDDTTLSWTTGGAEVGYDDAITDSSLTSNAYRYIASVDAALATVTRDSYDWYTQGGVRDEQTIDTSFSDDMPAGIKTALLAAGAFVMVMDLRNAVAATDEACSLVARNVGGTAVNASVTLRTFTGDWNSAPSGVTHSGYADVSSLYGLSAGTVYRIWGVYTLDGTNDRMYINANDLERDVDFRRFAIFNRTTFDADNATMDAEIAAMTP